MNTQQPLVVIVAVITGCVIGFGLFSSLPQGPRRKTVESGDVPNEPPPSFYKRDEARLWLALVTALWGILGGVAASIWPSWQDLMAEVGAGTRALVVLGAVAIFLVVLIVPRMYGGQAGEFPLWRHKDRITILFLVGCIPLGMAATGMVLVAASGRRLVSSDDLSISAKLDTMVSLRQQLSTYLGCAALIIGVTIIAIAALGRALDAHFTAIGEAEKASELRADHVVAYGVFFSGLLAIIFIPSYLDLQSSGSHIVDQALGQASLSPPSEDWFSRRGQLVELLALDIGWSAMFASAFALLTPLASGYLTKFIGLDETASVRQAPTPKPPPAQSADEPPEDRVPTDEAHPDEGATGSR